MAIEKKIASTYLANHERPRERDVVSTNTGDFVLDYFDGVTSMYFVEHKNYGKDKINGSLPFKKNTRRLDSMLDLEEMETIFPSSPDLSESSLYDINEMRQLRPFEIVD